MTSAAPLRDRNDPAWAAVATTTSTTPLRISKRAETPTQSDLKAPTAVNPRHYLGRRTSGSYTVLKDRKAVSQSPFLNNPPSKSSNGPPPAPKASATSRGPTSPRKVSGEKRQRTISMHDQAENEHPLGFKRRQSRGFQGLITNEPVSKSPFKKQGAPPPPSKDAMAALPAARGPRASSRAHEGVRPSARTSPTSDCVRAETTEHPLTRAPPAAHDPALVPSAVPHPVITTTPATPTPASSLPTPTPTDESDDGNSVSDSELPPPPPPKELFRQYSPSPHRTSSPSRPSLVSRRMHGPRSSNSGARGRSERRKTVTFEETCDVVEYEVDEEGDIGSSDEEDEVGMNGGAADPFGWVDADSVGRERGGRAEEDEGDASSFEMRANLNAQLNRHVGGEDEDIEMETEYEGYESAQETLGRDTTDGDDEDAPTQDVGPAHHDNEHDEYDEHEHEHDDTHDEAYHGRPAPPHPFDLPDSLDGLHIGAGAQVEEQIAGLVQSMMQQARGPRTPPRSHPSPSSSSAPPDADGGIGLPEDVETEDGVPLGRTHHAQRAREARRGRVVGEVYEHSGEGVIPASASGSQHDDEDQEDEEDEEKENAPASSPSAPIAFGTPPRSDTNLPSAYPGGTPPLGRSTHIERRQARRAEERELEAEVGMLPPSPSPAKVRPSPNGTRREMGELEDLVPRFEINPARASPSAAAAATGRTSIDGADPFFLREPAAKPFGFGMPTANLSRDGLFGSTSSPSGKSPAGRHESPRIPIPEDDMDDLPPPPPIPASLGLGISNLNGRNSPVGSLTGRSSPLVILGSAPSSRGTSPLPDSGSGGSRCSSPALSVGGRSPRISREDVQRRLKNKRSGSFDSVRSALVLDAPASEKGKEREGNESAVLTDGRGSTPPPPVPQKEKRGTPTPTPTPVPTPSGTTPASINKIPRVPPPPLTRMHPTYDGVLSIDPAPQPSDPPRPSVPARSASVPDADASPGVPFAGSQLVNAYAVPRSTATPSPSADKEKAKDKGKGKGVQLGDMKSALDRLMADVAGEAQLGPDGKSVVGLKVEAITEGVKAGVIGVPALLVTEEDGERGMEVDDEDASDAPEHEHEHEHDAMDVEEDGERDEPKPALHVDIPTATLSHLPVQPLTTGSIGAKGKGKERETSSTLLHASFTSPTLSPTLSPLSAGASLSRGPSIGTRDAIRKREELIKAKKREARRREAASYDEGDEDADEDNRPLASLAHAQRKEGGHLSRRRSRSMNDADALRPPVAGSSTHHHHHHHRSDNWSGGSGIGPLDAVPIEDEELPLADTMEREWERLGDGKKYFVRERTETIYAADADVHSDPGHGDASTDRAWRAVKRPSDMNEYAKQIRELQAKQNTTKGYAKVFVKVMGIRGLIAPVPDQKTMAVCNLNNGIHFVTTPEYRLGQDCRIDQEFELIEHSKLEFTLAIKVKRDPHIMAQFKANTAPPPPPPQPVALPPPPSKGGVRSFFLGGSTPKRTSKHAKRLSPTIPPPPPPAPPFKMQENLARYLLPDGTLGRVFVEFNVIAKLCDTRLFETKYRLIGQRAEEHGPPKTMEIGEVVLQIFRLPPLPGIPNELLPQSLEECHRGLRNIQWHKVAYFEGTLTQNGADCVTWRRRSFRLIGANLIAYNDVTKQAITAFDLKKAIAVEDDQALRDEAKSPTSGLSPRYIEYEGPYGVERSFRLIFQNDMEISFFADTDEEKKSWLNVLRALVGRIPPNPLWAEIIWREQQAKARRRASTAPAAAAAAAAPPTPEQQAPPQARRQP